MKSAGLDALERELGLVDDLPDSADSPGGSEGDGPAEGAVASVKPSERRFAGGCVQSVWLLGVFGGCVPAPYACWLHDWAILSEDKYAGRGDTCGLLAYITTKS